MKRANGFTIVELLIVIVVIAILATISIIGYNGIQDRVHDSAVQSDAANIAKKIEIMKIDDGAYPVSQYDFPSDVHISKGSYSTAYNNVMYCLNKNTDQYALGLISKSGKGWVVVSGDVQSASPTNIYATACNAVGATWANDTNSAAIHGYNVGSGVWNGSWSLTN